MIETKTEKKDFSTTDLIMNRLSYDREVQSAIGMLTSYIELFDLSKGDLFRLATVAYKLHEERKTTA